MEYMKSIHRRNMVYRGVVLVICIGIGLVVNSIASETSAHEESKDNNSGVSEIFTYEPEVSTTNYAVETGDTFIKILQLQAGISYEDSLAILTDIEKVFDSTKIRKGNMVIIQFTDDNFSRLSYDISNKEELVVMKTDEGFSVERKDIVFEIKESIVSGVIQDSLYVSGLDAGLTDRMIMELATVFAWDVDFTSSLRQGDEFSLVFENKYREGVFAGTGDLLAGRFVNDGKEFLTFLVKDEAGNNKYYNEDGDATERMLLKTPLSYKRISSNYSLSRKHPILGTFKTHRAIDFAADTGTPVETVGDGKVVSAGWNGAYGNYIKIDHGGGFATAYAHLSKIYVSSGSRVKQGDLIGAVGSTGRSTGPHLHYEMFKNGQLVHPLETKTPNGEPIASERRYLLDEVITLYKSKLF